MVEGVKDARIDAGPVVDRHGNVLPARVNR
jgi:hypothetical protein